MPRRDIHALLSSGSCAAPSSDTETLPQPSCPPRPSPGPAPVMPAGRSGQTPPGADQGPKVCGLRYWRKLSGLLGPATAPAV